jgi:hypothetical protein
LSKKRQFFRKNFQRKYFKNHNIGPWSPLSRQAVGLHLEEEPSRGGDTTEDDDGEKLEHGQNIILNHFYFLPQKHNNFLVNNYLFVIDNSSK